MPGSPGRKLSRFPKEDNMIVHNRLTSRVNGPGLRAVVWLQGCSLGCKGCWNPQTHTFAERDNETAEGLAIWILAQKDIEGVTFSGGEPLGRTSCRERRYVAV